MVYLSMLMALPDERVFRQALEMGQDKLGVEFFSFLFDKSEMDALKRQVLSFQGHKMTFHGPMRSAEMTAKKGTLALESSFEAYRRALSLAQLGGAEHMVVHTHECFITPNEKQARMQVCEENIHDLARVAAPYGVTLCVENVSLPHKGAPLFDQAEYISLFDRLPECKALVDAGHVHCTGWDMEAVCRDLSSRIGGFHLHNNDGREDLHAWLTDGTMNVKNTLASIRKYSEKADLVLEYDNTTGKTAEALLGDVAIVRQD